MKNEVEMLRKEMMILAKEHGFNHPAVISCSQKLDQVILQIQLQRNEQEHPLIQTSY